MRAAFLRRHGGTDVLEVGELPDPVVGDNDVRVRVAYSSLNHLDVWVRKGLPFLKLTYPHILGADASGIVDKIGAKVKNVNVGDEVVVNPSLSCGECEHCLTGLQSLCPKYKILGEHVSGTNAELISVPSQNIYLKPKTLSFQAAAALPLVYITAWEMVVVKGAVKAGQNVLIHGAGSGVTTAAIQIARLHNAKVFVTSTSDAKLEVAKKLGADVVINSKKSDFATEVKKHVKAVDLVIDHVGEVFWEANLKLLKWGGTLVTCGATSGHEAKTDLRHVFFRQLRLLGSTMGSKRDFPTILEAAASGKLVPVIDRVIPLSNVKTAHSALESSAQMGKVLLQVTEINK